MCNTYFWKYPICSTQCKLTTTQRPSFSDVDRSSSSTKALGWCAARHGGSRNQWVDWRPYHAGSGYAGRPLIAFFCFFLRMRFPELLFNSTCGCLIFSLLPVVKSSQPQIPEKRSKKRCKNWAKRSFAQIPIVCMESPVVLWRKQHWSQEFS